MLKYTQNWIPYTVCCFSVHSGNLTILDGHLHAHLPVRIQINGRGLKISHPEMDNLCLPTQGGLISEGMRCSQFIRDLLGGVQGCEFLIRLTRLIPKKLNHSFRMDFGICSCSQGERWSSIKNPISIQAWPLYSRDIACGSKYKYPLAHWYYPTFTGPIEAGMFNVGGLPVILITKSLGIQKKQPPHYVTFTNQRISLETHMTYHFATTCQDLPDLQMSEKTELYAHTFVVLKGQGIDGFWRMWRVRGLVVWSQIWDLRIVSNISPETRVSQKEIHLPTIPFDWPW